MTIEAETSVREIALGNPAAIRVFETLGIDYCCGGKQTLTEASTRAEVPLDRVLRLLADAAQPTAGADSERWDDAPLSRLIAHIVDRHHGYVRRETPRLESLLRKVISRHGAAHPEVAQIESLFLALSQELSTHMFREEEILFPYIGRMEAAVQAGTVMPVACFRSVGLPIANMVADHDDAGALLAKMRGLSAGYVAPADGCPTFRALYAGLEEFERDLHHHVHLENNILFPRAIQMEAKAEKTSATLAG